MRNATLDTRLPDANTVRHATRGIDPGLTLRWCRNGPVDAETTHRRNNCNQPPTSTVTRPGGLTNDVRTAHLNNDEHRVPALRAELDEIAAAAIHLTTSQLPPG
jgi:hypothetical protein